MSSTIQIRSIERNEALQMVDALMQLSSELPEAPHWTREIWVQTLRTERGLLIAEIENELAGFILFARVAGEAEIESLAVREQFQRMGVGRALILEALDGLRQGGFEHIDLELRAGNRRAMDFYREMGFKTVGRRVGYYAEPAEDAVLMSRNVVASEPK